MSKNLRSQSENILNSITSSLHIRITGSMTASLKSNLLMSKSRFWGMDNHKEL